MSVGQSLFTNKLILQLSKSNTINAATIIAAGATELRKVLSGADLTYAVESYMAGLKDAYALIVALGSASVVVVIFGIVFDRRRLGKGNAAVAAA